MERILENVHKDALSKLQASTEDGALLTDAAVDIVMMADVVRNEGLLALEELVENHESAFAKWLAMFVVDGTDYELLSEMAVNEYWMRASEGICAMVDYMYIRGMLFIQKGLNGRILAEFLQTLIPQRLRSEYWEKLQRKYNTLQEKKEKKKKECEEKFAGICPVFQDGAVIEKIRVLENKIIKFSDRELQRVLRDCEIDCVEMCIYAMQKEAKEKTLNNLSLRLREMAIADIVHFSFIDEREVLKHIEKALCIINKLSERGEICKLNEE